MALQGMKTVTEKKNETILILLNINAIKLNPVKLRDNDQILVCLEIQQQETNSPEILALEAHQARKTLPSG